MKREKSDNLDRMLSSRLKRAVDDEKRADWIDVLERAGMGRALWHWSQRRVLLVAGVLVLAAGTAVAATGIVPWLDQAPKPVAPTVYPICKASEVQAKLTLHQSSRSRSLTGSIGLVRIDPKVCALEGQPKVSIVGSGSDSARLKVEMFSPVANRHGLADSVFGSASDGQTLLGQAFEPPNDSNVPFGWENWCGSNSAGLALRLQIPNGSDLTLPVTKLPKCVDSTQPSRLVLEGANGAPAPVGADFPLRPKILPAKDGEPLVYEQGKVFHYRIALTNTSSSPYRFGASCPAYIEGAGMAPFDPALPLSGWFVYGYYVLNCHSVDQVDPGETVTFAMELPASMKAVDVKGGLGWQLDAAFPEAHPPMAVAPLTIVGEAPDYMPADEYSLFAAGSREAVIPPRIEEEVQRLTSSSGPVVPGSRRIVLKKGEPGGPLYAWETESGDFCTASGCVEKEQWTKPIWLDDEGYDSRGNSEIGGFAQDRVERVDMVVNGKPVPVEVKNNAFYAKFTGDKNVTAVIATLNDGSKVRVKLHSADLAGTVPVG